jgi:glycosyltransferase involved in cell wall biosynthesis
MNNFFCICNALDDATRLERAIMTDSPAASRKIFLLCRTMSEIGVRSWVISLGRGRQDGSGRYFQGKVCRINGVVVIYLPFLHTPILSELISLISIVPLLWRMRTIKGNKTALFYNRMPAYLLGLALAKLLQFRTILDLEDGAISSKKWSPEWIKSRFLSYVFDSLCSGGALLACSALEGMTRLRPILCWYGVCEFSSFESGRNKPQVTVLLGGTVALNTGAQLLVDAIRLLRENPPLWAKSIRFEISGKGDCLFQFEHLANNARDPMVVVHGRITDNEYQQVLARTQVGLALKPNSGVLANTTFPSKVIEFASHGILVVTTDISDVRKVLGGGAIYLTEDNPQQLIEKLKWIVENLDEANNIAEQGKRAVAALCAPEVMGRVLDRFLFGSPEGSNN